MRYYIIKILPHYSRTYSIRSSDKVILNYIIHKIVSASLGQMNYLFNYQEKFSRMDNRFHAVCFQKIIMCSLYFIIVEILQLNNPAMMLIAKFTVHISPIYYEGNI